MNTNRTVYIASKPSNGSWHPLGRLSFIDGHYTFAYVKGIYNQTPITPLPGMEDLEQVYKSDVLFPFFENRLLSKRRNEYVDFLSWSGFDVKKPSPQPLAILSVTEGKKNTDSYEVFPCPTQSNEYGHYEFQFFLHGLNHLTEPTQEAALNLEQGSKLYMVMDLQNTYNRSAVALRTENKELIGYLPNYMANEAYRLLETCQPDSIEFTVSKINTDAPKNFAILCKLDACWDEGSQPFSDKTFLPISSLVPEKCNPQAA